MIETMPEKIIKEIIEYHCDECGAIIEYSGKHEIIGGRPMWVHYCTGCHNRYDLRRIYPIYKDVEE